MWLWLILCPHTRKVAILILSFLNSKEGVTIYLLPLELLRGILLDTKWEYIKGSSLQVYEIWITNFTNSCCTWLVMFFKSQFIEGNPSSLQRRQALMDQNNFHHSPAESPCKIKSELKHSSSGSWTFFQSHHLFPPMNILIVHPHSGSLQMFLLLSRKILFSFVL